MLNKTLEKKRLEGVANKYLTADKDREMDQKYQKLIVKEIMPWVKGPRILEMGYGDDSWTSQILKKYSTSEIVDGSAILLKAVLKKYGQKVKVYLSFFEDFMPKEKYDTILATLILDHVKDPVIVLKQTKKWLKSNGKIIITIPNGDSLHRRLAVAMGLQKKNTQMGYANKKLAQRRVYNFQLLKQHIESADLKITKKRGLMLKPFPLCMMHDVSDEMLDGLMIMSHSLPIEYSTTLAVECALKERN